MNVELFVKQMNGEHKEGVIEKHIVRQYVPLEEKIAEAKKIIAVACYTTINDLNGTEKKIFKVDTVQKDFLATLALIKLYTDIDLSENTLKDYNMLAEKKCIKKIIGAMPEDARDFNAILNISFNDEIENSTSVGNIINRLTSSSDSVLTAIINSLIAKEVDNEKKEQGNNG